MAKTDMANMAKFWSLNERAVASAGAFRNFISDQIVASNAPKEDIEVMKIVFYEQTVEIICLLGKLNDLVRASLMYTHKYPIIWPDMFDRLKTLHEKLVRLEAEYSMN